MGLGLTYHKLRFSGFTHFQRCLDTAISRVVSLPVFWLKTGVKKCKGGRNPQRNIRTFPDQFNLRLNIRLQQLDWYFIQSHQPYRVLSEGKNLLSPVVLLLHLSM